MKKYIVRVVLVESLDLELEAELEMENVLVTTDREDAQRKYDGMVWDGAMGMKKPVHMSEV